MNERDLPRESKAGIKRALVAMLQTSERAPLAFGLRNRNRSYPCKGCGARTVGVVYFLSKPWAAEVACCALCSRGSK